MNKEKNAPVCDKCKKEFASSYGLDKHILRKIPCDRIIKCGKCNKMFVKMGDLIRHHNRKTPCEPIQGNMLVPILDNRCQFCGKEYTNKYSLKNHLSVCKIKNGGMEALFDTLIKQKQAMEKQQDQINKLEQKLNINNNIGEQNNAGRDIIKNHFNTTINIPLVCFMGDEHQEKMLQIVRDNLSILHKPPETDVPHQEQLCNRIGEFVEAIYRNPEHKELQNVYTKHDFEKLNKNNAFTYEGDIPSWHIGDWDKVSKDILNKIYGALVMSTMKNKDDVLSVMKTITSAAGFGDEKISDENLHELYCEIGRRMGFATLVLDD
jgi:hypothetical protein